MIKRKAIPPKRRLKVLQRDNYTCQICGKSPAKYPELEIDAVRKLEIDHVQPHSKKGSDDTDNLQTLCMLCNRGKGNNEHFNLNIQDKIEILLDEINPVIRKTIESSREAKVVIFFALYNGF
jgi:5-methylcytosine-specific restriction endonuclease McrA